MGLHIHENTLVKFTSNGMTISTGLNVTKEVAAALTFNSIFTGKVFKGEKMQIYKKARHIPSQYINEETVLMIQKILLNEVQTDIKLARRCG